MYLISAISTVVLLVGSGGSGAGAVGHSVCTGSGGLSLSSVLSRRLSYGFYVLGVVGRFLVPALVVCSVHPSSMSLLVM